MVTITIKGRPFALEDAFGQAVGHLQAGNFAQVVDICRAIVALAPDHFRAQHGIGLGLHRMGQSFQALPYIRAALQINPAYYEAHINLGNVLRESGQPEEALACFLRAADLRPEAPLPHFNAGNALSDLGRLQEALERYSRALELDAAYLDPLPGRARIFSILKEHEKAAADYRRFLASCPDHWNATYYLGTQLAELGRHDEAACCYRRAISLDPTQHDPWLALGNFLAAGVARGEPSGLDEAIDCYREALDHGATDTRVNVGLGNLLLARGDLDAALNEYRQAMEQNPDHIQANSCYVMSLHYHPAPQLPELYREAARWHSRFAAKVPKLTGHGNLPDPDRRLRIGYLSADLWRHPVGFHLMPALYHHSERFEIYCYHNNPNADLYTERLRSYSDGWRVIADLSDEAVQDMVLADGIDILVDLSGHTGGNRLLLFARKPAPVQVSWLGYHFSTGLKEIDYILMDDNAVLPGEERWFSEQVVRLPQTRFCYEPPPYAPEVAPLPASRNGCITFGSFNNLAKVTPQVVRLWARLLSALPGSRLLIKSSALAGEAASQRFLRDFADQGIAPERLILRGQSEHKTMLAEYGDVDIALDPFPFNGGITSCEALWMGVPVLTLTGDRPIARQSTAFLRTIGLTDFVAGNEEEYCALASRWADNISELALIRSGLRRLMKNSLLCDGKRFSANLESAYREMWRNWCGSR